MAIGVVAATTVTAAAQSDTKEAAKATDVGITPTEIHVAVIADVDNPIVPNLFRGSKDAVEGAAKFLNSKAGGGGLAGRKSRGRLLRLQAQRQRDHECRDPSVRERCRNGRNVSGVVGVGRQHAQLQGLDRCSHRTA